MLLLEEKEVSGVGLGLGKGRGSQTLSASCPLRSLLPCTPQCTGAMQSMSVPVAKVSWRWCEDVSQSNTEQRYVNLDLALI